MSARATFAGWCYLRDGTLVGPVFTDELVAALFRGQVDPESRVYRIRQNGREYALLVPEPEPPASGADDRSLAPPDMRADESVHRVRRAG
jgi:hypothetical protein